MTSPSPHIDPPISALLNKLRGWIRAYVWLQGAALSIVVLGLAFWASFAFDWLVEPPRVVRGIILAVVGIIAAVVIYRYILRRAFVAMSDRNLALLVERSFPKFGDSLVTSVELSQPTGDLPPMSQEMLEHTRQAARDYSQSDEVRLPRIFRWRPLVIEMLAALVLLLSVTGFALACSDMFRVWRERAFLQSDDLWPRRTALEVAGFDKPVKVARGSDLEIRVRASGEIPETVEFRYVSVDGGAGRETMTREGRSSGDDGQQFVYTVKSIASSMQFEIVGGDNRLRNLQIDVVESPTLVEMALHCEFPEYLGRTPRDLPVTGLMQLPRGSKITLTALGNKPLVEVPVQRVAGDKAEPVATLKYPAAENRRKITFDVGTLLDDQTLLFSVLDTDGIRSREPVRLSLAATPDEPPKVALRLRGIGTSITPQARLPLEGEISDDYGVSSAWFEYSAVEGKSAKRDGPPEPADKPTVTRKDFRAKFANRQAEKFDRARDEALDIRDLKLQPGQRLLVQVKAADNYGLEAKPNIAAGEQFQLDVVSPEQLLTMLQARELGLRRRFETIIEETTKTRDALATLSFKDGPPAKKSDDKPSEKPTEKSAAQPDSKTAYQPGTSNKGAEPEDAIAKPGGKAGAEPGDKTSEPSEDNEASPLLRRQIGVGRAIENAERSGNETSALAGAFDDLLDEVVNNRMDATTPEIVTRLRDQISAPLHQIGEKRFVALQTRSRKLEASLGDLPAAADARQQAVVEFDAILIEMNSVLDRMQSLENFNVLVQQLRDVIDAQARLTDETKRRQKEEARNKLDE